jgi:hypothetical protein
MLLDELIHRRLPTCPFLGSWWDAGTQHGYVTDESRCFATTHTERFLWFLHKEVPGGQIALDHQTRFCFADFASCGHYTARMKEAH